MPFDNGETSKWQTYAGAVGVADPSYAVTPLRGTYSLRMKDDATEGTWAVCYFDTGAGYTELYGAFLMKVLDLPITGYWEFLTLYHFWNGGASYEAHEVLELGNTGNLKMRCGGTETSASTTALVIGQPYYIWWYVNRVNGSGWVKISQSPVQPTTNSITWSGLPIPGSYSGTNGVGLTTYHGSSYEYLIDQFLVKTSPIGSLY
jgi:hypothetical protein